MFPELENIQNYGPEIMASFCGSNLFWKEVFDAYKRLFYQVKRKNSTELLAEQVFYNKRIQIGKHYIQGKRWSNKGIVCIGHFIAENGLFISHDQFKEKFDLNTDFLTFAGMKSAIGTYIRETGVTIHNNRYLDEPKCIKMLLSVTKGSKSYYDTLIENDTIPKCCIKWNEKLNVDTDWKACFLQTHKISDMKLKWFQIRIIHRCV